MWTVQLCTMKCRLGLDESGLILLCDNCKRIRQTQYINLPRMVSGVIVSKRPRRDGSISGDQDNTCANGVVSAGPALWLCTTTPLRSVEQLETATYRSAGSP